MLARKGCDLQYVLFPTSRSNRTKCAEEMNVGISSVHSFVATDIDLGYLKCTRNICELRDDEESHLVNEQEVTNCNTL